MAQLQPKVFPVEKVLNPAVAVSISGAFASGTITLTDQPMDTETLTLNGTAITFVASGPTGAEVLIGANATETFANLLAFLQGSVDAQIVKATYAQVGVTLVVAVTYKNEGTGGNAWTMTTTSAAVTLSGAHLTGGTASSISTTIACSGLTLVGIQLPAAFTSTAITFKASIDGSTWQPVYNSSGQVSYTVAQGRFIAIDPKDFYGISYLQLITGSDEVATRNFTVALKGI